VTAMQDVEYAVREHHGSMQRRATLRERVARRELAFERSGHGEGKWVAEIAATIHVSTAIDEGMLLVRFAPASDVKRPGWLAPAGPREQR
jgi:hypothetical protein